MRIPRRMSFLVVGLAGLVFLVTIGATTSNAQTVEEAYDATLNAYNQTLNQMEECDLKFQEFQQMAKKDRPPYYASSEDWEQWRKNYVFSVVIFRYCMDKLKREADNLRKKLAELGEKLDGASPNTRTPPKDPKPSPRSNEEEVKRKKLLRELIEALEKRLVQLEEDSKRAMEEMELRMKAEKASKPDFKVETTSAGGLSKITFTNPQGRIFVYLPSDIREGDAFSGTVIAEANGNTPAERASFLAAVSDYQVILGSDQFVMPVAITYQGTSFAVPQSLLSIATPPKELQAWWQECANGKNIRKNVTVTLFKSNKSPGRSYNLQDCFPTQWTSVNFDTSSTVQTETLLCKVGYIEFKTESNGQQKQPVMLPASLDRDLRTTRVRVGGRTEVPLAESPCNGQQGHPLTIKGSFDGDLRTTELEVGGQALTPLAESSRSCIFKSPEGRAGMTEVSTTENGLETRGAYRNVGVRLSAPKTSLLRGEKTTVTLEVSGLGGIQKNVPLRLASTGVINMEGGNVQNLTIRPSEVKADGTYTTTRAITGQQAGGFGVTATVINPAPIIIPLIENGKVNGFRVKKEGDKFVVYVKNVQSPITGDPVEGEVKLEHQCPTLSKIPYVNRLFLNKGIGKSKSECLILITPRIIIQEEED